MMSMYVVCPRFYITLRSGTVSFSFSLLTTLRHPGLPGMHPHCCTWPPFAQHPLFPSLHSLALFLPVFAPQCPLLSFSDPSLSFAAVLLVIVLKTPMLFVTSGKPSGAPFCCCSLVGILIPSWSLSFAAVFVVGPKVSFVVSD